MLSINLSKRTALVTGGSRGIGEGIVRTFASAGANVIINYGSNREAAEKIKQDVEKTGIKAWTYQADVSDSQEVKGMFDYFRKQEICIDILVNNTGIGSVYKLEDLPDYQLEKIMKVNLFSSFYCSREVITDMKIRKSGVILNIASSSIYTGGGGGPHYAASKAGMLGLTRNLSKDYSKYNIRTNALALSLIETDMLKNRYSEKEKQEKINQIPIGRFGTIDDVGNLCAFLASDLGSYINGEIIMLDGGRTYS